MPKHLSSLTTTEIENIKTELQERLKTNAVPTILPEEQLTLANAIEAVKYPYSVKDILVYIDKNTANLLENSAHPLVQQWGKHCKAFYENSPCRQFVVAETGIVTTSYLDMSRGYRMFDYHGDVWYQGMSARGPDFVGQGVWNLKNNCWIPSPNSVWNSRNLATRTFHVWLTGGVEGALISPPALPPLLSTVPLELVTPQHIAALLGNMDLMKNLVNQGLSLDTKCNHWEVTPLEMAVSTEQLPVVAFLLQQEISQNLEKAQLLAVKEGSMAMIDTFLTHSWLSQAVLEVAREREPLLFTYLDERQRAKVDDLLKSESSMIVLQKLLNSAQIPSQLLADMIAISPEMVLNPVPGEPNENTLLHHLVNTKDTAKVTHLLEAMFNACYLDIPNYTLDCEKKNKQGQTVLDLALSHAINEITSAILLYGNPKNLSLEQQNKLIAAKIDIGAITRDREQRALKLAQNDHKAIVQLKHAAIDTIKEVMSIKQVNAQIIKQLEIQNQQIQMQQQMLHHFAQMLGFNMDPMSNSAPMLLQVAPDIRFFGPQEEDNNKVLEQTKAYAFEQK